MQSTKSTEIPICELAYGDLTQKGRPAYGVLTQKGGPAYGDTHHGGCNDSCMVSQPEQVRPLTPRFPGLGVGGAGGQGCHTGSCRLIHVENRREGGGSMDQISIKTPNPKCRLFLRID
jgi:hypothetical protein